MQQEKERLLIHSTLLCYMIEARNKGLHVVEFLLYELLGQEKIICSNGKQLVGTGPAEWSEDRY